MIKNIIFDMDGTILNTLDDICDSLNYTLSQFGYPTQSIDKVRSYVGNGIAKLIERALPCKLSDVDFEEVFKTMTAHYDQNKNNKTAPYDGILKCMQSLKEQGINMAVVSNKYDGAVKALTQELFGEYITVAIGESSSIPPKPAPEGVWHAMQELDATADNSVYIGDSEVDFATAKNSKLTFIGVTWGFRTKEILQELGTVHFADTPHEILTVIQQL